MLAGPDKVLRSISLMSSFESRATLFGRWLRCKLSWRRLRRRQARHVCRIGRPLRIGDPARRHYRLPGRISHARRRAVEPYGPAPYKLRRNDFVALRTRIPDAARDRTDSDNQAPGCIVQGNASIAERDPPAPPRKRREATACPRRFAPFPLTMRSPRPAPSHRPGATPPVRLLPIR